MRGTEGRAARTGTRTTTANTAAAAVEVGEAEAEAEAEAAEAVEAAAAKAAATAASRLALTWVAGGEVGEVGEAPVVTGHSVHDMAVGTTTLNHTNTTWWRKQVPNKWRAKMSVEGGTGVGGGEARAVVPCIQLIHVG